MAGLSPVQPMALDDKFRIGSNTKTFVVTVLLQLVDEKRLSLDDQVSKFDIEVATIISFVSSQREKPGPGVANSIVRDIGQILFPDNVAFSGKAK